MKPKILNLFKAGVRPKDDETETKEDQVFNLLLCEKLFQSVDFHSLTNDIAVVELRLLNVFMLVNLYQELGHHERLLRYLGENTRSNMYLKDLLERLSTEAQLSYRMVQNYVL